MYFRIRMSNNWNYIFFIAKKLQRKQTITDESSQGNKKAAKPITRIAILSISLAMIVNIVTIAVVEGFQQEVSRKVIGFGSHISIQKSGEISLMESAPLVKNPGFEKTLQKIEEDDFGFCDSCGIEIGIRRLEARPTADQCIDCKTLAEIKEKQMAG